MGLGTKLTKTRSAYKYWM